MPLQRLLKYPLLLAVRLSYLESLPWAVLIVVRIEPEEVNAGEKFWI